MSPLKKTLVACAVVALSVPLAPVAGAYGQICVKNNGAYWMHFTVQKMDGGRVLNGITHPHGGHWTRAFANPETSCWNPATVNWLRPGDTFRIITNIAAGRNGQCEPHPDRRHREWWFAMSHRSDAKLQFKSTGTTRNNSCTMEFGEVMWSGCARGENGFTKPGCHGWRPAVHRTSAYDYGAGEHDIAYLASALRDGANINVQAGPKNDAPLHRAVRHNAPAHRDLLISRNANPNIKNADGQTPLMLAILNRDPEPVKALLRSASGVDPHIVDNNGRRPLHEAVRWGNPEIVQALLDAGANPHSPENSVLPITEAARQNNQEIIAALVAAGASPAAIPDYQDSDGNTAAHRAAAAGDNRALYDAIHDRRGRKKGANLDIQNIAGNTPLHLAVANELYGAIDTLVRNGANPDIQNNDGDTPVHLAARNGFDDIVRRLLRHGADPDIANNDGETPLQIALAAGHSRVAALLRKPGDAPEEPDAGDAPEVAPAAGHSRAFTPNEKLFHAVRHRNEYEIRRLLNEENADPTAEHNGQTMMQIAQSQNDSETALLLADAIAATDGNERAEHLDAPNKKGGATVLHVAASRGMTERVESYLAAGANPNLRDKRGRTPLMRAIWGGELAPIVPLLQSGADPTIPDNEGRTPLQYAEETNRNEIAALLREATQN